jgi:DNA repair protein RadC
MEENNRRTSIKNWSEDDRPREKLLLKGKTTLSDAELMAILIASGSKNETAVDLSKRILNSVDNNLIELSKLTVTSLKQFKGIGEAKAITIVAALELGSRRRGAEVMTRKSLRGSKDAFEIFKMHIGDTYYEQFLVIMLNQSNKIVRVVSISEGGVTGTVVDPKKIFKLAIDNNATGLVLGHNHPSGNILPSQQDKILTTKLIAAGKFLDIPVLDHIIIGEEDYYSFADNGRMA